MSLPERRRSVSSQTETPGERLSRLTAATSVPQNRSRRDAVAISALNITLGGPFQLSMGGPGGWIFAVRPTLRLAGHTLAADIAGWRRERMTERPDALTFEVVPDWVMTADTHGDSHAKLGRELFARAGVEYFWSVDTHLKVLETYSRDAAAWRATGTFNDDDVVWAPPFEVSAFSLSLLWPLDPLPAEAAS